MKIDQNYSFSRVLNWSDSKKKAIDTTNYIGKFQIRQGYGSAVVVEISSGNGITISNDGVIKFTLTSAQTKLLTSSNYIYELALKNTITNEVVRLIYGDITVNRGVIQWD